MCNRIADKLTPLNETGFFRLFTLSVSNLLKNTQSYTHYWQCMNQGLKHTLNENESNNSHLFFNPAERDPCDSSPCRNGGTCTKVRYDVFKCTCAKGFTGNSCAQGKKKQTD